MQKFLYLSSFILLCSAIAALFITVSTTVRAIDEVTATPSQSEATQSPTTMSTEIATEVSQSSSEDIDIDALIEESLTDMEDGRYENVVDKMSIILDLEADNATAYFIRGLAYIQLSLFNFAISDLTSAIELEPWIDDFYAYRGDAYNLKGESGNALLDYESAISLNPSNPINYTRRSRIYFALGDNTAGDTDALIAEGIQATNAGNFSLAIEALGEAIDSANTDFSLAYAYYTRGTAHLNSGDFDAAIADYTQAVENNPELHHAYLVMGISQRLNGNLEAAGQNFYSRITIHADEIIELESEIGAEIELETTYRRAYAIQFEGKAGQLISITARDASQGQGIFDPLIALVAPGGEAIAGDDDFGGALDSEISNFELPEDGTYILYLSHAEGGREFGFRGMVRVNIDS